MKEVNKLNDMEALLEELSEESTLLDDKSGAGVGPTAPSFDSSFYCIVMYLEGRNRHND